jgi:hypothetical protein
MLSPGQEFVKKLLKTKRDDRAVSAEERPKTHKQQRSGQEHEPETSSRQRIILGSIRRRIMMQRACAKRRIYSTLALHQE